MAPKKKTIRNILIGGAILALLVLVIFQILENQTKKASPEDTIEYSDGQRSISVFYCRPYKKGREIFGGLVPYGEVWRTGANEATTFSTSHDISIGRQKLPAGKYTLWTIPYENHWTVIFNHKMYRWGVGFKGASRQEEYDQLTLDVPVQTTNTITEQFTIAINEAPDLGMDLMWDQTRVRVPLSWE